MSNIYRYGQNNDVLRFVLEELGPIASQEIHSLGFPQRIRELLRENAHKRIFLLNFTFLGYATKVSYRVYDIENGLSFIGSEEQPFVEKCLKDFPCNVLGLYLSGRNAPLLFFFEPDTLTPYEIPLQLK